MGLNQLNAAPAAGFDTPLALLTACHERMLHFCTLLERLLQHMQGHGADLQAQETARRVIHYFTTAAPLHHQDEEQDLFPLLLEHEPQLHEMIGQLKADHEQLDAAWGELYAQLRSLEQASLEELNPLVEAFVTANRAHLQRENRELLPRAAAQLSMAEQESLGRAMAARRNVAYATD